MEKFAGYFTPTLDQIAGLGALLIVCAGLVLIGRLCRGRTPLPELDLVAGWGIASLSFIVVGGLLHIDFRLVAGGLLAVAAVSAVVVLRQPRRGLSADLGRTLALALPLLWLTACMTISQWDEFTHWMPNARYLVEHNMLPGAGNPPPTSNLPGYPHTLAFVIYLSSLIAGHLAENVSAVFNVVLMAFFAVTLGRVARDAMTAGPAGTQGQLSGAAIGWTYCAVGGLAVTGLNPTFVPKIVFTAYADTPTMVLIGMLCIVLWLLLNTLAGDDKRYAPASLAWGFGLIAMAAVGTKQPNIVLCGLTVIAGILVAVRDPEIRVSAFLRLLPAMIFPALAIYVAWRLHVETNHVEGEFNFLARKDWLLGQIDVIAGKMVTIASKKGGYFGVMLIACLFAGRALWRIRHPFDRLSLVVAVLFLGYVLFLLFVYVTAFGGNGLVAPSFWRFNMHLGGACIAFGTYGAALLWRNAIAARLKWSLSWLAIGLLLAAPFAFAYKIRFDQHPPSIFVRKAAAEAAALVPEGARFGVWDVTGSGEFEVIARYVTSPRVTYVGFVAQNHGPTQEWLRGFIRKERPEYLWIHVPTEAVNRTLGVDLQPRHAHLVKLNGFRGTVIRSWPYPGYDDPNTVPD